MASATEFFAAFLIAAFVGLFLAIRREVRAGNKATIDELQKTFADQLHDMLRKGHGNGCPTAAAVVTEAPAKSPTPAPIGEPAPVLRTAIGMSIPFRPSPAQVAEALALSSGPVSSETPAAMRARIEAAEDERDSKRKLAAAAQEAAARAVAKVDGVEVEDARATVETPATQLPPLAPSEGAVSDGDRDSDATHVYDTGARRTVYGMPTLASMGTLLGWLSNLSPEDLARVDSLADDAGIPREEMLGKLFGSGSADMRANDAPTTPPDAPANDGKAPPPSGKRRQ